MTQAQRQSALPDTIDLTNLSPEEERKNRLYCSILI
jgi:hypothetical protein